MNDNDDETLDYISSVDPFTPEVEPPSIDADDEKALKKVSLALAKQKKRYETIEGMKQFDTKEFNANQREAMCAKFVELLISLEKTVNNAIDGIKEKQDNAIRR
jgi:predicted hydrolase (HD superfamily)